MKFTKLSKREKLLNFIAWISGILVSLTVGCILINGSLNLPTFLSGQLVSKVVGWIIIVTTLLSLILSLKRK